MGYMHVYRVGNSRGEAPLGKVSRLLNGEGIDCEELGDQCPESGCQASVAATGNDQATIATASKPVAATTEPVEQQIE